MPISTAVNVAYSLAFVLGLLLPFPAASQQLDAQEKVEELVNKMLSLAAEESPSNSRQIVESLDNRIMRLEHEAVLSLYVGAAAESDIEKMLSLTSPAGRERQGDTYIRQLYATTYVPIFSQSSLDPRTCMRVPLDEPNGDVGSIFICRLHHQRRGDVRVAIGMAKDEGNYVSGIHLMSE